MSKSRKGNSYFYTPLVEISAPKMKPIALKGNVEYRPSQSLEVDLNLSGVTKSPIVTKGMSNLCLTVITICLSHSEQLEFYLTGSMLLSITASRVYCVQKNVI